jgi:hypothetical protein
MKRFFLLVVAVAVSGVSCERHEFEGPGGTKQLHEHHGSGSHGDGEAHADEAHGEKPAH